MAGFAALNAGGRDVDMDTSWKKSIQAAFPDELQERIFAVAPLGDGLVGLFGDIARHVQSTQQRLKRVEASNMSTQQHNYQLQRQQASQQPQHSDPPQAKKRKLEDGTSSGADTNGASSASGTLHLTFSCKDVSCQIPLRKKLKLELLVDGSKSHHEIRLVNQTSNETEYTLHASQIEQAFCMAVPDKQARQTNFVLYPKPDAGVEAAVFAVNETAQGTATVVGEEVGEGETYDSVVERALSKMLGRHGLGLVKPTEAEFASAIPQSHRKGEKGFHVRAHRGSKEGYLFFLPTGILFGFKKPLAFFPSSAIESVSYTSVLQRTFNLVVASSSANPGSAQQQEDTVKEVEFSMLDQADFAGIDAYVQRHGLHDASMAAQRRAKAYNVNKVKKEAEGEGGEEGGEKDGSELQKAEQALQDAEDEEEEDYEASGGESEGEGSESDEDGEGSAAEEYDEDDEDDAEGEDEL